MRKLIPLAALAALAIIAFIEVDRRLTNEAVAIGLGVVFGVCASIPTSLLIVAATRGRATDDARSRATHVQPAPPTHIHVMVNTLPPAQPTMLGPMDFRAWHGESEEDSDSQILVIGNE